MACLRCHGAQWICEEHQDQPWPHEWCEQAGMPCPDCSPMAFNIVPATTQLPEGWQTVTRNGEPVWHGPPDKCARFVSDPEFRAECLRSRKLAPE